MPRTPVRPRSAGSPSARARRPTGSTALARLPVREEAWPTRAPAEPGTTHRPPPHRRGTLGTGWPSLGDDGRAPCQQGNRGISVQPSGLRRERTMDTGETERDLLSAAGQRGGGPGRRDVCGAGRGPACRRPGEQAASRPEARGRAAGGVPSSSLGQRLTARGPPTPPAVGVRNSVRASSTHNTGRRWVWPHPKPSRATLTVNHSPCVVISTSLSLSSRSKWKACNCNLSLNVITRRKSLYV